MGICPSEARPYLMLHVPERSITSSKSHLPLSMSPALSPSLMRGGVHPVTKPPTEGSKAAAHAPTEATLINSRLSIFVLQIYTFMANGQHVMLFVFSFSNRIDPNISETIRILWISSVRDFYIAWHQRLCRASAGLCGRHLWLRLIIVIRFYYKNPTLHIGVWLGRPFRTRLGCRTLHHYGTTTPASIAIMVGPLIVSH